MKASRVTSVRYHRNVYVWNDADVCNLGLAELIEVNQGCTVDGREKDQFVE